MPTHTAYSQAVRMLSREVGHPTTPDAYEQALPRAVALLRGLAGCAADWDTTGDPRAVQAVKGDLLDAYLAVTAEAWAGVRSACVVPADRIPAPRTARTEAVQ